MQQDHRSWNLQRLSAKALDLMVPFRAHLSWCNRQRCTLPSQQLQTSRLPLARTRSQPPGHGQTRLAGGTASLGVALTLATVLRDAQGQAHIAALRHRHTCPTPALRLPCNPAAVSGRLTLIMASPWETWESSCRPETKFLLWVQYCRPDSSMAVQSFSSWQVERQDEEEEGPGTRAAEPQDASP